MYGSGRATGKSAKNGKRPARKYAVSVKKLFFWNSKYLGPQQILEPQQFLVPQQILGPRHKKSFFSREKGFFW